MPIWKRKVFRFGAKDVDVLGAKIKKGRVLKRGYVLIFFLFRCLVFSFSLPFVQGKEGEYNSTEVRILDSPANAS